MKIGTKSVLFGAHCFFIHPWFVAWAWWKLFGFPWDPRLWVAFIIHDLGYIGKPNMDGPEGEKHVQWAARIMTWFFDQWPNNFIKWRQQQWVVLDKAESTNTKETWIGPWGKFCLFHSRFYAKKLDLPVSKLCYADKLSFSLTPRWLYLPMVNWTGEIHEYMALAQKRTVDGEPKYYSMNVSTDDQQRWWNDVKLYMEKWVAEHKDGKQDTWTPKAKQAKAPSGVWA